jgi:ankyrin repeat protein
VKGKARVNAWIPAVMLALLWAAPPPDSPIADAAMREDIDAVRSLLREGAAVNVAQSDGMTALHWAAELGNVELVRLLVDAGADLEAPTRIGDLTPLHIGAEVGQSGTVRALLEAGANAESRNANGSAPLHFAAMSGSVEAVVALADHGADVNLREAKWGQTPLMFAASRNRVSAIEALIDRGGDVGITSKVVLLQRLSDQDKVANAVRDSVLSIYRAKSPDPETWAPTLTQTQEALRAARAYEPVEPVEAWEVVRIDWDSAQTAGRAPTSQEKAGYQGGLTALLHAVREGHPEAAIALLEGGADINQPSGGDLSTPINSAMINGHYDLGLELLKRGADPDMANYPSGITPLYAVINTRWASKSRYPQQRAFEQQEASHIETMKALLEAGADVNARLTMDYWYLAYNFGGIGINTWGATPFWRATHGLDIPAMKLLVEYGADPHMPTKAPAGNLFVGLEIEEPEADQSGVPPIPPGGPGTYPIHAASGNSGEGAGRAGNFHRHVPDGWLPALKYLVEGLGADVTLRDHLGYGTIHGAAGRGMNDVILYLVDQGADPLIVGRSGRTTIDLANGPANGLTPFYDTIELLESMGAINNHLCVFC